MPHLITRKQPEINPFVEAFKMFSLKAADLQNILENHKFYKYFKISLHIHIIVVRNQNNVLNLNIALKTDNSLFCHRDIPTIHNG